MKTKPIVPLAATVILLVLFVASRQFGNNLTGLSDSPTNTEDTKQVVRTKIFASSKYLDFTVQLPTTYQAEESAPIVNFRNGEIVITLVRNTTPFNTLKESLDDYDAKNKLKNFSERKELEINGYQATTRVEARGDGHIQKVYYIYVDNWLYIISTEFESGYSDLDQIARSFRYTP